MTSTITIDEQRALLPLIKAVLIDTGRIDPECYTHKEVEAAKEDHECFSSVEDIEQLYTLFKRVTAQVLLARAIGEDLDKSFNSWSLNNNTEASAARVVSSNTFIGCSPSSPLSASLWQNIKIQCSPNPIPC